MTKKLLIVAHAPSSNTLAMRDAVVSGAQHGDITGVEVTLRTPFEATADDVLNANGLILGTTENLGYMSGALKDFFDRIYYPCLEETQGMPFCYYIRAGHDGTGTNQAIKSITTGLKWRPVQEPLICKGGYSVDFIDNCSELGMAMSVGLEAGIF